MARTKTAGPPGYLNRCDAAAFFVVHPGTIENLVARYHVTTRLVKSTHFYPVDELREAVERWADEKGQVTIATRRARKAARTKAQIG